jgi:hypothetical protein
MRKLFACAAGAVFFLSACGGGSEASDPADTSVVAQIETSVAETTPDAPAEADNPPATEADAPASTAAAGAPSSAGGDPVAQVASMLGITDAKDLECLQSKIGDSSAVAGAADPELIRALLDCQPPSLVAVAVQQLQPLLPNATPDQLTCAAKASLTVVAKSENLDITALMGGITGVPEELRGELLEKAKECGLSAEDVTAAFSAGPTQ